jgi:uncharacterized membrane protein YeaQ/YmgE (transglycosylase-associated protein family)
MGIILWVVFGALVGWITSVIMKTDANQRLGMDIFLGIVGAVVGGFVMQFFGQAGVTGFNLYSLVVAVIGSIIVVQIGRMFR